MFVFRKTGAAAFAACVLHTASPAWAIDDFFPNFGNNGIDVKHYDLDLTVEPWSGRLDAEATLNIVALRKLPSFSLDLSRLSVASVHVAGDRAGFAQGGGKLTITPRDAIARGDVFNVAIAYSGKPRSIQDPTAPGDPSLRLGWFKYGKASYVVSEPVGASTFFPANDELTDKATYKIAVTVPEGLTGVANGVLTSTSAKGGSKRFVWEMRQPMTTWLATVHVNRFKVKLGNTRNGTLLRFYTTQATPPGDADRYALAGEMLDHFESLIGRYPFDGYGSVVVDDPILYYALETQAMSTFELGTADQLTVAHELAHQWFGNSVSIGKWEDIWIAEGGATYFEIVWVNRNNPRSFRRAMEALYDEVAQQQLGPAVVDRPEDLFSNRVYSRGAAALYALRLTVGENTFYRILRRFLSDFRGSNATSKSFIETAVAVSGDPSVRDLMVAWLYKKPVPDLPGRSAATARSAAPAAPPDIVGLRCGRGAHRGGAASC